MTVISLLKTIKNKNKMENKHGKKRIKGTIHHHKYRFLLSILEIEPN